jgi:branched-chain amino acid transport system substrate-binding protein
MRNIKVGLENSSIPVSGTEPVTMDDRDYTSLSHRIINGAPDTVAIIVYDDRQIPIIRNLSEAGFRGQVILTESGLIAILENEDSDALSKFSLFTILSNTNLVPGSHSEYFVTSFKKRFDKDPTESIAGYGYDSMMVIADAIRSEFENSNVSAENIQKGLDASRYYGVTGPKVFDYHHAVGSTQDRWVFKDGKLKLTTISLN